MKTSINCNYVEKNEILQTRNIIPDDLHWKEELKEKMKKGFKFLGEIYNNDENKYYSSLGGKKYRPKHREKHLDEGHFQGYRFAIQKLTKEEDWVFDPTVGSGTAIIESINNKRNAIGIELEWPSLCKKNVEYQIKDRNSFMNYLAKQKNLNLPQQNIGIVIDGNARDLNSLLEPYSVDFQLIINGTPYPVLGGGKSSDAPQRKKGEIDNYQHVESFGLLKWNKNYEFFIRQMYKDCIKHLKKNGYLVIIIKDPVRNKKPFYLQKYITDWIKEDNKEMKDYGFFIHKHIPQTFFMRTYPKMFPDVLIPYYQIGYILKKN